METKLQNQLYYYQFEGDEYDIGKQYGKLLRKRNFNSEIIKTMNQINWENIKEKNSGIIFKIIKKKIDRWVQIIKSDYQKYIKIQTGLAEELKISLDTILELDILGEMSGIFCTIYCDQNKFYRILDTSLEHRKCLINIFDEIHVLKINDYLVINNPGYFNLHTVISEKLNFATFGNNLLDKKEYLKNDLPFYIRLKKYFMDSKDEDEFIKQIKNDSKIFYDVEIIIGGQDNNYNVHAINKTLKESNVIERSDYTPIKTNDLMNLHKELPDYNRIFAAYYHNNKLYVSNSLVNNEMIEIF